MKQSLKISSFIIFTATVASTFTSCGNESELFDEPVMYQTKAMTRASMGGEELGRWVIEEGSCTSDSPISVGNLGIATAIITITWEENPTKENDIKAFCDVTIHENYRDIWVIEKNEKKYARIPNGEDAEAEFTVELKNTQTGAIERDDFVHYNGTGKVHKKWVSYESNTSTPPVPMNINLTDSLTIQNQ